MTFDYNVGTCRPIFTILALTDSQENSLCNITCFFKFHLNCVATLPCEIQKSKITAERLFILSKLVGFTWNLTKLNNSQMTNATKISSWWFTFVQYVKHIIQITQERWKYDLTTNSVAMAMSLKWSKKRAKAVIYDQMATIR